MPAKKPKSTEVQKKTIKNEDEPQEESRPEDESTISYLYRMISHPQLRAIGADFIEKLIYLYFLYIFQRGVGATFMAFDSMLLGAFNAVTGREPEVPAGAPGSLTQVRYNDPTPSFTELQLQQVQTAVDIGLAQALANRPIIIPTRGDEGFHTPPESLRHSGLRIMPEDGDGGRGLHGGALSYAAMGAIGKKALEGLLLTALTAAVGAYAIKDINDTKNLNYDAERTDPLYIPPKQATYDIGERAKTWVSEVKHKKNMSNILDEWNDISGDVGDIGHFSGSYGLGLKKQKRGKLPVKLSDPKKVGKKNSSPLIELSQAAITASEGFKDDIKYARDNNLTGNALKVFIAVCLLAGVVWGAHDSTSEEYSIDHGRILSDIMSKNISLSGVVNYVTSMFEPKTSHLGREFERGEHYGLGLKKKASKKADKIMPDETAEKIIPETFYQKRIKPIANKIYNVVTSDETITVAKALSQLAFLTAVMYGIKELGLTAYSSMSPADTRPAQQQLIELGESEIGRPTYYTEAASGRYRGRVTEYDKSRYPKDYPQDVGADSPYSEDYTPSTSKINRLLSEAGSDIYRSKEKTDKLIEVLKKEDPIHIKNLMLKHPILRDIKAKKPHKFTTEFPEQLPTLKEKINWKKGQLLSGKGLKEDAIELSKATMSKLKKMAKKIYDKIKSEEGQIAVKGLTVATILAGLTALMRSRMGASVPQLSPEELKEQYMEGVGESVLFY